MPVHAVKYGPATGERGDDVRRLLPDGGDEPLDALYLDVEVPLATGRPWVYLDMVASVDGAATVGGVTADLGGEADGLAFRRLRETCDAILVGAGTVRAENYGQARADEPVRRRRAARGLAAQPTMVVVTRSLDLDPDGRLFTAPGPRPLVLTGAAGDPARRERLAEVAEVVTAGETEVDLAVALEVLYDRGHRRVLCEGGPRLNAQLVAADLVDELFLTITPCLVSGDAPRIVHGGPDLPRAFTLREAREHDSELLLRYRRQR